MTKKPIRQDPLKMAGTGDIAPELQEQLDTRATRKRESRRRKRPKQTYDLPAGLITAIKEIAGEESVSQSDIAAYGLAVFVAAYRAGEVDLSDVKVTTRSLRVDWKLEIPEAFGDF